jgi:hypothetical protein
VDFLPPRAEAAEPALRRRSAPCVLLLAVFLTGVAGHAFAGELSSGEALYRQAQGLEAEASYTGAAELYGQALPVLLQEGNAELAYACGEAARKLAILQYTYPDTLEQSKERIREAYPQATGERIEDWTSRRTPRRCVCPAMKRRFPDAA